MVAHSLPPPAATTAEGEVELVCQCSENHVNGPGAAGMYPGQGREEEEAFGNHVQ